MGICSRSSEPQLENWIYIATLKTLVCLEDGTFFAGVVILCFLCAILHVITKVSTETGKKKCATNEIQFTYDFVAFSTEYARFEHSKLSVLALGTLAK